MSDNQQQHSPPLHFSHGFAAHWQTVYPFILRASRALYRPVSGDLLTVLSTDERPIAFRAWVHKKSPTPQKDLFILSHGLEGSAESGYIQETAQDLHKQGYDVWAWYMRGCSSLDTGPLLYHSGFTLDLHALVEEAKKLAYRRIYLVGFSVGGNITLKLLGEGIRGVDAAVCFSVPLKLEDVAVHLSESFNGFYMKRFLLSLKAKIRNVKNTYPEAEFNMAMLDECKDFESFDEYFTAPMHGYSSAHEYYTKASSYYGLQNINTPCLIVNACNDPFLTRDCFPDPILFPNIQFQYPSQGGHCGFKAGGKSMVARTLEFIAQ